MNKILLVLKHSFEWHKRDFIITYAMIPAFLFAYFYFQRDPELNSKIGLLLFVAIIYSARLALNAYVISNGQRPSFSFKYLASLPWSRRELVLAAVAQFIFVSIPVLIFISLLFYRIEGIKITYFLLGSLIFIPYFVMGHIYGLIKLPRLNQLMKTNRFLTTRFPFQLGLGMIVFASLIAFTFSRFDFWRPYQDEFKIFSEIFGYIMTESLTMLTKWPIAAFMVGGLFLYFGKLMREWQNERLSFPKNLPGKPYFEFACAAILVGIITYSEMSPPFRYAEDDILTATFNRDRKELERLFANGVDVNYVGRNKIKPIMVAAFEGDLEMFKYLQFKGANLTGTAAHLDKYKDISVLSAAIFSKNQELVMHILNSGYDYQHDMQVYKANPLHRAAKFCMMDAVNHFVAKGYDVQDLDQNGETVLHEAARGNCLEAFNKFVGMGINPHYKNYAGLMAKQLSYRIEMKYAYEEDAQRLQRLPASLRQPDNASQYRQKRRENSR